MTMDTTLEDLAATEDGLVLRQGDNGYAEASATKFATGSPDLVGTPR